MGTYHIEFWVSKNEQGEVVVDAHLGNKTEYPPGTATCIADAQPLDAFLKDLKETFEGADIGRYWIVSDHDEKEDA